VKQLKAALTSLNGDIKGILEKSELVEMFVRLNNARVPPKAARPKPPPVDTDLPGNLAEMLANADVSTCSCIFGQKMAFY